MAQGPKINVGEDFFVDLHQSVYALLPNIAGTFTIVIYCSEESLTLPVSGFIMIS